MSQEIETRNILCMNGAGGCFLCCGLIAHVDKKKNRLIKIEPDPANPTNLGRICDDRADIGPDFPARYLYHPAQIMRPLKRAGERGEGKWQEIGYDQALDEIAAKLKELKEKYGPETLSVVEGTFRTDIHWARFRFLYGYGNPGNFGSPGNNCHVYYYILDSMILGDWTSDFPNPTKVKCLVLHAVNPPEAFPTYWWAVKAFLKNIDCIITIDPRCTEAVRHSSLWLQIRPGTDTALFMGWMNRIIQEKLYDQKFLEEWTNAAFLVRTDKMKLLRESDIRHDGKYDRFVVIDAKTREMRIYDPETLDYDIPTKPELEACTNVTLVDGKQVICKTAWVLLKERVAPYTAERVEDITWVPARKVIESARLFATIKPAGIARGVPTDQIGINSSRAHQCRTLLHILTGNVNVIGGLEVARPGPVVRGKLFIRDSMLQMDEQWTAEQKKKQLGSDVYKVNTWPGGDIINKYYTKRWGIPANVCGASMLASIPLIWRAILQQRPYPVTALISWISNCLVASSNTKLVYEALKSPNLKLHVVVDHIMTPTAELADYVMPSATKCLESPFCATNADLWSPMFVVSDQAIKPLGERRDDYMFWKGLCDRMGFGHLLPWKDKREMIEYRLRSIDMTYEHAVKKAVIYPDPPLPPNFHEEIDEKIGRPKGFATITKKVEIWPAALEELGYDALPSFVEPFESPISKPFLAKEYPLILNTGGRFRPMFHSEYRHWGMGMREQRPWPLTEINYDTARRLGISNGDWVWIETPRGRILQKACVSAGIHPKVVNVESSWWYPEQPAEEPSLYGMWISNANVLTPDDPETLDPLSGGWSHKSLLCKVYKAKLDEVPSFMRSW